ncbi:unnamed protein product, partial [Meganyctiphanes norvegica]
MKNPASEKEGLQSLGSKFFSLQEERVLTYRQLDDAHKVYLATGPQYDFSAFRAAVHHATVDFKRISESIIDVEKNLRENDHTAAADLIKAIQDSEKKKLEFTAHLQLARQMLAEPGSGQMEVDKEREIRGELGKLVEEINDNLSELRYEAYNEK